MKAIERIFLHNDLVTITFFIGVVLLFLMKLYKPQRLLGYALAFFTQGFIEKRAEQNPSFFSTFHSLLFLFSITTISLCFFLFPYFTFEKNLFNFLIIICSVLTYFLLHVLLDYSISSLLEIKEDVLYFLISKSGYLYSLCLWLFPVLIIYNYGFNNSYFLSICLLILVTFRFFLILKNNKKLIFIQLFYFILYFCALELAPLLVLYKTTTE